MSNSADNASKGNLSIKAGGKILYSAKETYRVDGGTVKNSSTSAFQQKSGEGQTVRNEDRVERQILKKPSTQKAEVEKIQLTTKLEQGYDDSGTLVEGMQYEVTYEFEVIKFKNDNIPSDDSLIKWSYRFEGEDGAIEPAGAGKICDTRGRKLRLRLTNNPDICGRELVIYAFIESKDTGATFKKWVHYRFRWLSRKQIKQEVADRVGKAELIDQGGTSLCGIAVVGYNFAKGQSAAYEKFVLDMHRRGDATIAATNYKVTIDSDEHLLKYKQTDKEYPEESATKKKMATADFVFLVTIRDYLNDVFDYDPDGPNAGGLVEGSTGITFPGTVASVMKNVANYQDVINDTNLLTSKWETASDMVTKLKEKLTEGYRLAIEINADNFTKNKKPFWTNPNHWVGLLDICHDDTAGTVWVQIYTWGSIREYTVNDDVFTDGFFGYVAGK